MATFRERLTKNVKAVEGKEKVPKRNPFDPSLFYKIYIPDLIADILLVIFGTIVSNEMFSGDGLFYHLANWQNAAMYCVVVLSLPWYLGYLYQRNSYYYSDTFMKVTLWVFILMTLVILINLARLVFVTDFLLDDAGGIDEFMGAFASFLLVLGPMMCIGGSSAAVASFEKNDSEEFDAGNASATGALFMIVTAIVFMILIIGQFPDDAGWGAILLAYIGGPFLAVVCWGLILGFLSLLNKFGIYKYLSRFARNTFPFFIVAVLVFWTGVALHFMMSDFADGTGKVSTTAMVFSVLSSGLVPFRIIMLFNAPVRITNIVIGIFCLGYFLIQMVMLTK